MTTDIRITKNQVFATVTGKDKKLAQLYGVRIEKNRYWFTIENWKFYQEEINV